MGTNKSIPTFRISLSVDELNDIIYGLSTADNSDTYVSIIKKLNLIVFKASNGLKSADYVRTGTRTSEAISVAKLAEIDEFDTDSFMAELETAQKAKKSE